MLPSSAGSNFSLSDSVSDIVTLDMTDDYAPSLFRAPMPVFEKEGSLDSSMIMVIVSLSRHALCTPVLLQIFSSTGRQHPLSSRFSFPTKRIGDIEGHHYYVRD